MANANDSHTYREREPAVWRIRGRDTGNEAELSDHWTLHVNSLEQVPLLCLWKLCHMRTVFCFLPFFWVSPSTTASNAPHLTLSHQFVNMRERLTYRVVHTLPVPESVRPTAIAINPEGTLIAAGCANGGISIWCLNTCDLICQASPPGCACGGCATAITSMMWLRGGALFFGRRNGLMGVIRVGKVRQRSL